MANDKRTTVLQWKGRPCIVTGERKKRHPKFGWFTLVLVHFLDGLQPTDTDISRGKFAAATAIRGPQADVWRRVDELVTDGMEPKRAATQAMAELVKGVLAVGQAPE